ncbi:MAG: ABC transporter ATP-binding protein [Burkholderiales bacterium]|nr:ABC transporter ATP-binding protein [Burkholderiales bacterium]
MLRVDNLLKRYGDRVAVDGISFAVEKGQTIGLLGPNGAGKTTTLAMITGLTPPDGGSVSVGGRLLAADPDGVKRGIGLVPQDVALYEETTARANLQLFGALYGMQGAPLARAIADALALVGLADRAGDKVASFSGGMKRRLNIAGALLHDPELILLDEPTVGVDPQSRNAIFDNLAELRRRGKTLVYTTHYMEEAERLCDRIVVMDHGRIMADDTLPGLLARAPAPNRLAVDIAGLPPDALIERLRGMAGVHGVAVDGERLVLDVDDLLAITPQVLQTVSAAGLAVRGFASERANLESVFLTLTGRSLRDE